MIVCFTLIDFSTNFTYKFSINRYVGRRYGENKYLQPTIDQTAAQRYNWLTTLINLWGLHR